MSKSLIRKNQLHPDIADLISGYGDNYFINQQELNSTTETLTQTIQNNITSSTVLITGDQTISGVKTFTSRPFFNGFGLATTGEIGGGGSTIFNGNRTITRSSFPVGSNVGGTDVVTFLNNVFFPFQSASISLQGYAVQELGTTYSNVPYVVTINSGQETLIYNLQLSSGANILRTIVSPSFGTNTYYIIPTSLSLNSTTTLTATVTGNNNGSPSPLSSSQQITFEAPYYWGASGDNLAVSQIKNLNKVLTSQPSSITQSFTTVNNYFYLAYPSTWPDLTAIKDSTLQNLLNSFTKSTITSTSWLSDARSYAYKVYKFNNISTISDYQITFTF